MDVNRSVSCAITNVFLLPGCLNRWNHMEERRLRVLYPVTGAERGCKQESCVGFEVPTAMTMMRTAF
jgi:hypothetical protein